jgi:hypothetical protein
MMTRDIMRDIYNEIKDHFRSNSNVEIAEGKGAQGLKYNGKMFAMFYKGDLTVKLKPENVKKCIETGEGLPHDPGTGKPMKDRILVPASKRDKWIEMCELSLRDVM